MKNGITKGQGNSQYWKTTAGASATYPDHQSFMQALEDGTFLMEQNGINASGWVQQGTPLDKAHLLSDGTAIALGLSGDPSVDDALGKLGDGVHKVGDIRITMGKNVSDDWVLCNGGTISASTYPKLISEGGLEVPIVTANTAWTSAKADNMIYAAGYWCYISSGSLYYSTSPNGTFSSIVISSSLGTPKAFKYINNRFVVIAGDSRTLWFTTGSSVTSSWSSYGFNSSWTIDDITGNGTQWAIIYHDSSNSTSGSYTYYYIYYKVAYSSNVSSGWTTGGTLCTVTTSYNSGIQQQKGNATASNFIWTGTYWIAAISQISRPAGNSSSVSYSESTTIYWWTDITGSANSKTIISSSGSNSPNQGVPSSISVPPKVASDGKSYIVICEKYSRLSTSYDEARVFALSANSLQGPWATTIPYQNDANITRTDITGVYMLPSGNVILTGGKPTYATFAGSEWVFLNNVSGTGPASVGGNYLVISKSFTDKNNIPLPLLSFDGAYAYLKVK